jgi:hypothetical protein
MARENAGSRTASNPFQDWMEALANRHGQIDLHLEHIAVKLPWIPEPVEVNGTVSLTFHMRELTEKEREARIAKEIRALR